MIGWLTAAALYGLGVYFSYEVLRLAQKEFGEEPTILHTVKHVLGWPYFVIEDIVHDLRK